MKRTSKNIIMILVVLLSAGSIYLTMNYAKNNIKIVNNQTNNNMSPPDIENNTNTPPDKPDEESDTNTPPDKPDEENNINTKSENQNEALTWQYYLVFGTLSLIISVIIIHLIMSEFNKKTFKETYENPDKIIILVLLTIISTTSLTYIDKEITSKYLIKEGQEQNTENKSNVTYNANEEINEDKTITGGNYTSDQKDENAILVTGDVDVNISNIEVTKTADSSSGDNTSFYGINSAILAKDNAHLTLENVEITTNANGANGVFSYGGNDTNSKTTIDISDSKITTTKDNSGGIMTTGGGITNATNLEINTSGISSAAIRSDRGGGTINVNKGTYKTTGAGSPTIYSTADIKVSNANLISTASEGIVIEGQNSVNIDNCTLTDTNNKLNGQSTTYKNIFLYQSMSGDAQEGLATFTATNSTITTNKGDSFYVTNTKAQINLTNNTIVNNDKSGNFLRIQKDSWGKSGSNGGDVTLNLTNQTINGDIVVDEISTLNINMKNSSYEGTINNSSKAKEIVLNLDRNSKIKLTNDTYITTLNNEDTTNSNIDFNGYKLYINNVAIN